MPLTEPLPRHGTHTSPWCARCPELCCAHAEVCVCWRVLTLAQKHEYCDPPSIGGASGGEDGMVRVFDLRDGSAVASHPASNDTLNGFEFHPYLPFAASSSGD